MKHITHRSSHDWLTDSERLAQFTTLYELAFPIEERRHLDHFIDMFNQNSGILVTYFYDNDHLIAFAVYYQLKEFIYVEYIAVHESLRNQGLGQLIIETLISNHPTQPIVLECEPPNLSHEAKRRIKFYQRNGFTLLDVPYFQPPYHRDQQPLPLKLMVYGTLPVELEVVIKSIHALYPQFNDTL